MLVALLVLCVLIQISSSRAAVFEPTATFDFGTYMADAVVDAARDLAYVSARDRDSVLVLSLLDLTLVDEIPVGDGPMGMAMDRLTDRLYVTLQGGSGGIAVVNLTSRTLAVTWPLPLPFGAVDVVVGRPGRIYVSGSGISAHDTSNGSEVWWTNFLPSALAISPDFRYLYSGAKNAQPADVVKWDVAFDSPLRVGTNRDTDSLSDIAVSVDGTRLYLAASYVESGNHGLAVLDTGTMTVVDALPVVDGRAVAVSPDGARVLAGGAGYVAAYSTANGTRMDGFAGPYAHIRAIGIDPLGRHVLISQTDWNQLSVNRLLVYAWISGGPTPPITELVVGAPNVTADTAWVSSHTPLSFAAVDRSGTGIRNTTYRVDGGPWRNYTATGPFRLTAEGKHAIEWFSMDVRGDREALRSVRLRVDDTPPITAIAPATGPVTPGTNFTLVAADAGAGVARSEYRVDGGPWIPYASPFALPVGGHVIGYRSVDRLNNTEEERTLSVAVEVMPAVNWKPVVAFIFSLVLVLAGVWSSRRAPWSGGRGRRAGLKAFALLALPFVVLEAATGVVSLATGLLSIPPVLGVGTVADPVILVVGLAAAVYRGTRAGRPGSESPSR